MSFAPPTRGIGRVGRPSMARRLFGVQPPPEERRTEVSNGIWRKPARSANRAPAEPQAKNARRRSFAATGVRTNPDLATDYLRSFLRRLPQARLSAPVPPRS